MERARTFLAQTNQVNKNPHNIPIHHVQTASKKWRFRPRTIWPFVIWGVTIFAGLKITIIPLAEGVYYYVASTSEIHQLKNQCTIMQKQLVMLRKKRDYMKTSAYVEERAHEIGLVKSEESQMVVAEGIPADGSSAKKNDVSKR